MVWQVQHGQSNGMCSVETLQVKLEDADNLEEAPRKRNPLPGVRRTLVSRVYLMAQGRYQGLLLHENLRGIAWFNSVTDLFLTT